MINLNGKTLSRTFEVPQGDAVAVIKVNNAETNLEICGGDLKATNCTGVLATKGRVVLNSLYFGEYKEAVVIRENSKVEVHGSTDFALSGWPFKAVLREDLTLFCANMCVNNEGEINGMLEAIAEHVARDEDGNANEVYFEKWDNDDDLTNDEGGVLHIVDYGVDEETGWEKKVLPTIDGI